MHESSGRDGTSLPIQPTVSETAEAAAAAAAATTRAAAAAFAARPKLHVLSGARVHPRFASRVIAPEAAPAAPASSSAPLVAGSRVHPRFASRVETRSTAAANEAPVSSRTRAATASILGKRSRS